MLKIKEVKPLFTSIITTANKYEETETINGILIDSKKAVGTLKEYQTVISIGNAVREVKPGDVVLIDPSRYMIKDKMTADSIREEFMEPTYHMEIPMIEMNDSEFLRIEERDVSYIITDYEEVTEEPSLLLSESSKLIIPNNNITL